MDTGHTLVLMWGILWGPSFIETMNTLAQNGEVEESLEDIPGAGWHPEAHSFAQPDKTHRVCFPFCGLLSLGEHGWLGTSFKC